MKAIEFALLNSPVDDYGKPWVTLAKHVVPGTLEVPVPSVNLKPAVRVLEVVPLDFRRLVEETNQVNFVDIDTEVLTILAQRCLLLTQDVNVAVLEARFRLELARMVGSGGDGGGDGPVTVDLKTHKRVFEPEEIMPVVAQVDVAREVAERRYADSGCSPILNDVAPVDPAPYMDQGKSVVVVAWMVNIRLGVVDTPGPHETARWARVIGDLFTRFMWDVMMYDHSLAVVGSNRATLLSLYTDKAPGLLHVKPMQKGVPCQVTSTSEDRKTRNPHPALGEFVVENLDGVAPKLPIHQPPDLTKAECDANPFLQDFLRGPLRPSEVPGCKVSIYVEGSGAGMTHFAGTNHSWPAFGALIQKCAVTPKSDKFPWGFFDPDPTKTLEEQMKFNRDAMKVLAGSLYNAAALDIWSTAPDAEWRKPGASRREAHKAYGMGLGYMHAVLGYRLYPKFACEIKNPRPIRVWALGQVAASLLQWDVRYGRVQRRLLANHRRRIRYDFATVIFRNYLTMVRKDFGVAPGPPPTLPMTVSALNAFKVRTAVVGIGCLLGWFAEAETCMLRVCHVDHRTWSSWASTGHWP